ncbi:MAG TPA: ABC transporter permease subunit [Clostridiaceae bacterium]|nr:ABC transporter permease subunit [Clostridiaceae bacterium]
MRVFFRELKSGFKSFSIWTLSIAFFVAIVMLMFPEMSGNMNALDESFANMGGFTDAFGLDVLKMTTAMGFYGIESGNIVGIGTAMYAALLGINSLAKEEGKHTAEFLISHPIKRSKIVTEKLSAVFFQIILMNLVIIGVAILSFQIIGEEIQMDQFLKLHLATFFMNIQLAAISFMISAFLKGGGAGIGLGLALSMYFLGIIANITDMAKDLKYITPFKYAEAAQIFSENKLLWDLIGIGMTVSIICILIAYWKFTRKDIAI